MAQNTVDTLIVEVIAELGDVNKKLQQLEKNTQKTSQSVGRNLRNVATAVKGYIAFAMVRELATGANAAVNFASHVEEMQAKAGVVFGEFSEAVRGSLEDFGKEVGRSAYQLEEMAASVQDTFVPMGFARGQAANLSVELTKLATDVASFNNASDTETMKAFQSALVGNHETVRQFGIVITEAELDAELFRMGITKAKDQVTAAEKVQARYNLILAGTSDAHGDAARTAESYANKTKAMEGAIERLQVAIGQKLMPMFSGLVESTTEAADALADFLNGDVIVSESKTVEEALGKVAKINKELMALAIEYGKVSDSIYQKDFMMRRRQIEEESELLGKQLLAEEELISTLEKNAARATQLEKAKKATQEQEATAQARKAGTDFMIEQQEALALLNAELHGATEAQLAFLQAQMDGAAFSPEQIAQYEAMSRAVEDTQRKLEGINAVRDTIKSGIEQMSNGISQSISNMVMGVGSSMNNLKSLVSNIISQIIQKMIQMAIVNRAINAMLRVVGAPESMMLDTIGGSASGGAIQPNTPRLVGERGPELIIPKSASTVRNAADTRNILGGGPSIVVNQSLNFSTGVQATVRSEVMAMMPQINAATKAAVAEQAQRGGSYTRSF